MYTNKKKLEKSEYLNAFDTFCEKVWTALNIELPDSDNAVLLFSDILLKRQQAMLTAYKKYGPVYYNYIEANLMLPLQNSWIRLEEYKNTSNVKYLIDVLNFIMLAYWKITSSVAELPCQEQIEYLQATLQQYAERFSQIYERYFNCLELYSDTDELCCLAILAYYIYSEILNPTQKNAFYNGKPDGRVCALAGIYINQLM